MKERFGYARFVYPEGIVTRGPWFSCSSVTAKKIREWASIEWRAGTKRPG